MLLEPGKEGVAVAVAEEEEDAACLERRLPRLAARWKGLRRGLDRGKERLGRIVEGKVEKVDVVAVGVVGDGDAEGTARGGAEGRGLGWAWRAVEDEAAGCYADAETDANAVHRGTAEA